MNHTRLVVVVIAVSGALACETERAAADLGATPNFATPSASFQTSYVTRGASSIDHVRIDADVVVRPDRLCVPIEIDAEADDDASLAVVQAAAQKLAAAALAVDPGSSLRIDDISARSDRTKTGARSSVSLRGVIETALSDGDAWTRAKQVAALHHALALQATLSPSKFADADKVPTATVVVGAPEPGVKDIEVHRGKLLASWAERAKALASAVDGAAALDLVNCVPPAQVVVVGGTLEKVGLSLPVTCTFAVKR